jgi:hypothetical protein
VDGIVTYNAVRPVSKCRSFKTLLSLSYAMQTSARFFPPCSVQTRAPLVSVVKKSYTVCIFHKIYRLARDTGYVTPCNPELKTKG